jgi:hypothetical protein
MASGEAEERGRPGQPGGVELGGDRGIGAGARVPVRRRSGREQAHRAVPASAARGCRFEPSATAAASSSAIASPGSRRGGSAWRGRPSQPAPAPAAR